LPSRRLLASRAHAAVSAAPSCSQVPSRASVPLAPHRAAAGHTFGGSTSSGLEGRGFNAFSGARRKAVSLSPDRLREFINAELNYFAQRKVEPLSLAHIVQASTPRKALRLVYSQIPTFFARRVKHIEQIEGWATQPELVRLREIFMESFRELRMVDLDLDGNLDNCVEFNQAIYAVRKRHKPVTALLGEAMRKMHREDPTIKDFLQNWSDIFLTHRISTEMLTSHYVAIIEEEENRSARGATVGIVDTKCNPGHICEQAAAQVLTEFPGLTIEVKITNCLESKSDIEFSYIPRYLFYVVQELLRNSAKATAQALRESQETGKGADMARPIVVMVCADQKQVAIRISDEAGGVPFNVDDKIWSYFFSTSDTTFQVYADGGSPLSGWGMGLPLGRLYARYLSGTLELMNMPGIGVDAYLFVNRISLEESATSHFEDAA